VLHYHLGKALQGLAPSIKGAGSVGHQQVVHGQVGRADGDLETVAYLVEKGADVNRAVPANPGQTRSPLGEAVKRGHRAVADYLRAKGARA